MPKDQTRHTRHYGGLVSDTIVVIVGIALYGALRGVAKPFVQGFFCNDDSIKYPLKKETISLSVLCIVGSSVPLTTIIIVECWNHFTRTHCGPWTEFAFGSKVYKIPFWVTRLIERLFITALGGVFTQIVTDVLKLLTGELRPHFLDVCKPNQALYNCSDGYISLDVCTGNPKEIHFARKSFPSGHASFAAYSVVFVALYLQFELTTNSSRLLRPFVQSICILLGIACGLTRISDFMHHPVDVLFGFLLGMLISIYVVFCILRLHQDKCWKPGLVLVEDDMATINKKAIDASNVIPSRDGLKNFGADRIP